MGLHGGLRHESTLLHFPDLIYRTYCSMSAHVPFYKLCALYRSTHIPKHTKYTHAHTRTHTHVRARTHTHTLPRWDPHEGPRLLRSRWYDLPADDSELWAGGVSEQLRRRVRWSPALTPDRTSPPLHAFLPLVLVMELTHPSHVSQRRLTPLFGAWPSNLKSHQTPPPFPLHPTARRGHVTTRAPGGRRRRRRRRRRRQRRRRRRQQRRRVAADTGAG